MPEGGRLLVCATPIGNLGDVTIRVLDALREADVVCAEDTRVTRRLLARYGIETPMERYDEHVAGRVTPRVLARIAEGGLVALVSDAGTPGVSDPGSRLVAACLEAGLAVEVLPGPSAILAALVASGLPTHAFHFAGFLPRKAGEAARRLADLGSLDATLVFYESPRRAASTMSLLASVLPGRRAAVARELTKLHEEVVRGTVEEVAADLEGREGLKGEVVLLVGPGSRQHPPDGAELARQVAEQVAAGSSRKEAARAVADRCGVSRSAAYEASLRHGSEDASPPGV